MTKESEGTGEEKMEEMVIGYVFHNYGYWERRYYFEGSAEKVATFIYQHRDKKITITDTMDCTIYKTPRFYEPSCSDLCASRSDLCASRSEWCDLVHERVIYFINHESQVKLEFIQQDQVWMETELVAIMQMNKGEQANGKTTI